MVGSDGKRSLHMLARQVFWDLMSAGVGGSVVRVLRMKPPIARKVLSDWVFDFVHGQIVPS